VTIYVFNHCDDNGILQGTLEERNAIIAQAKEAVEKDPRPLKEALKRTTPPKTPTRALKHAGNKLTPSPSSVSPVSFNPNPIRAPLSHKQTAYNPQQRPLAPSAPVVPPPAYSHPSGFENSGIVSDFTGNLNSAYTTPVETQKLNPTNEVPKQTTPVKSDLSSQSPESPVADEIPPQVQALQWRRSYIDTLKRFVELVEDLDPIQIIKMNEFQNTLRNDPRDQLMHRIIHITNSNEPEQMKHYVSLEQQLGQQIAIQQANSHVPSSLPNPGPQFNPPVLSPRPCKPITFQIDISEDSPPISAPVSPSIPRTNIVNVFKVPERTASSEPLRISDDETRVHENSTPVQRQDSLSNIPALDRTNTFSYSSSQNREYKLGDSQEIPLESVEFDSPMLGLSQSQEIASQEIFSQEPSQSKEPNGNKRKRSTSETNQTPPKRVKGSIGWKTGKYACLLALREGPLAQPELMDKADFLSISAMNGPVYRGDGKSCKGAFECMKELLTQKLVLFDGSKYRLSDSGLEKSNEILASYIGVQQLELAFDAGEPHPEFDAKLNVQDFFKKSQYNHQIDLKGCTLVLIVDSAERIITREKGWIRLTIENILNQQGINCKVLTKPLAVGDFAWIVCPPDYIFQKADGSFDITNGWMVDHIFERKVNIDFCKSLSGAHVTEQNHHYDQKLRLSATNFHVTYIIEGCLDFQDSIRDIKILWREFARMQDYDGFHIVHNRKVHNTIDYLVKNCRLFYDKMKEGTIFNETRVVLTWVHFRNHFKPNDQVDFRVLMQKFLIQTPGIGPTEAKQIALTFPTIGSLIRGFDLYGSDVLESVRLPDDLQIIDENESLAPTKVLGTQLSQQIERYWFHRPPPEQTD